jgi:hypothetical protein
MFASATRAKIIKNRWLVKENHFEYLWDFVVDVHEGQQRAACEGSGPAVTPTLSFNSDGP